MVLWEICMENTFISLVLRAGGWALSCARGLCSAPVRVMKKNLLCKRIIKPTCNPGFYKSLLTLVKDSIVFLLEIVIKMQGCDTTSDSWESSQSTYQNLICDCWFLIFRKIFLSCFLPSILSVARTVVSGLAVFKAKAITNKTISILSDLHVGREGHHGSLCSILWSWRCCNMWVFCRKCHFEMNWDFFFFFSSNDPSILPSETPQRY